MKQNELLIVQGKKLGIKKYIMPFFEKSELNKDNMQDYIKPIIQLAKIANKANFQF